MNPNDCNDLEVTILMFRPTCKQRNNAHLLILFLRTAAQANATTEDEPEKVATTKQHFDTPNGTRAVSKI